MSVFNQLYQFWTRNSMNKVRALHIHRYICMYKYTYLRIYIHTHTYVDEPIDTICRLERRR